MKVKNNKSYIYIKYLFLVLLFNVYVNVKTAIKVRRFVINVCIPTYLLNNMHPPHIIKKHVSPDIYCYYIY